MVWKFLVSLKNGLPTLFGQVQLMHTFLLQTYLSTLSCCGNNLRTLFCHENDLRAFFVAKTIYALRPESFCALKVAIRKVQTFWASELYIYIVVDLTMNMA